MYVCLDSKRLSVISIPCRTIHVQNTKKNCNKICEGKLGIASRTELKTEAVSSLRRSALGNAHHTQRQRCNVLLPGYAQKDVRDRQFGPSCLVSSSSSSMTCTISRAYIQTRSYEKEACYTLAVLTSVLCMSFERLISRLWRSAAAAAASNKLHQIWTRISTCSEQEAMSRAMCTQHTVLTGRHWKSCHGNVIPFNGKCHVSSLYLGPPNLLHPEV